jgi:hypothetical protein
VDASVGFDSGGKSRELGGGSKEVEEAVEDWTIGGLVCLDGR